MCLSVKNVNYIDSSGLASDVAMSFFGDQLRYLGAVLWAEYMQMVVWSFLMRHGLNQVCRKTKYFEPLLKTDLKPND